MRRQPACELSRGVTHDVGVWLQAPRADGPFGHLNHLLAPISAPASRSAFCTMYLRRKEGTFRPYCNLRIQGA